MAGRRRSTLQRFRRDLDDRVTATRQAFKSLQRVRREVALRRTAGEPVVWLMLTPAARMKNLGDFAQVPAVLSWLRDEVGVTPIELDKDEYARLAVPLRRLVAPADLILLQSGGNMGERGRQTERLRRRIISDFGGNTIVSLPQSISFSNSQIGRAEAALSAPIYRAHPDLEVVARDPVSLQNGRELFGPACHRMAPDFVLRMARVPGEQSRSGALLVLRADRERRLSDAQTQAVEAALADFKVDRFDTKVDRPVRRGRRQRIVNEVLDDFARHELVVTDRFHGMIFAYVTDTPCLVLEAIDHKVRTGVDWLDGTPRVRLASPDEPLAPVIAELLAAPSRTTRPDVDVMLETYWAALAASLRERLPKSGGVTPWALEAHPAATPAEPAPTLDDPGEPARPPRH
jgi:pyruvyl transferase EpsI